MCAGCFTDTRVLRLFEVVPLFGLVQYFVFVFYPGVKVVNLLSPLRTRYVGSRGNVTKQCLRVYLDLHVIAKL